MTKVEQIERQIQDLSQAEFAEIREWILERDWEAWDEQIQEDVREGKLDDLVRESKTLFDLRGTIEVDGPQDFEAIRESMLTNIATRNAESQEDRDA